MRPKIHCVIPPFCPAPANHARFSYNRLTSRQTQYRLLHLGTNLITYFNTPSLSAQHPNRSSLPTRPFSTSYMMASDADYMSFLDKANQDVSGGDPKQGDMETQTVHSSISVPEALKSVEIRNIYYVSDTDEPFEPVALERDEKSPRAEWPGAAEFSSLISPGTDTDLSESISILPYSEFDPNNQYSVALNAVREAADEDSTEVKVYQIGITSTKIEYWILALHQSGKRLVGLRTKAVES